MQNFEDMYYYLDHAVRKALKEIDRQNFGIAREELSRAQKTVEQMCRGVTDKDNRYEYFRNPYDSIER